MSSHLKRLFFILLIVCIPAGFFTEQEHALSLWHAIPSIDVIFGGLGALLLILGVKLVGSFASRKEDFYD